MSECFTIAELMQTLQDLYNATLELHTAREIPILWKVVLAECNPAKASLKDIVAGRNFLSHVSAGRDPGAETNRPITYCLDIIIRTLQSYAKN